MILLSRAFFQTYVVARATACAAAAVGAAADEAEVDETEAAAGAAAARDRATASKWRAPGQARDSTATLRVELCHLPG